MAEPNFWLMSGSWLIAAILEAAVVLVCQKWGSRRNGSQQSSQNAPPWRKNVLVLMGLAYGALLALFVLMVWLDDSTTAKEAYQLVSVPFVALVGGTLTIAKDIIN